MADRPTVSIITATHNALEGLKKTVASVASQTAKSHEHIIVDGGSSDGTAEWLASGSQSLRWVSEADTGIGDAMNKGITMAEGEWVLVLHAEDTLMSRESLAEAIPYLQHDVDVVCFDVDFMTSMGSRRLVSRGFSPKLNFKPFPHQGAFTRRSLFERNGKFDTTLKYHMDYDFYLRAYRVGATSVTPGSVVASMPDTGITSRLDWESLAARFAEEKLIHGRYVESRRLRLVYGVYWSIYPAYRKLRARLDTRRAVDLRSR